MGRYVTASGNSSIAFGTGAHTSARQGSFVFADRAYGSTICDMQTLIPPYGQDDAGCATTGDLDTLVRAPWNNSYTVRAIGGTYFHTNATQSTGLRLSSLSGSGGNLYGSFVWTDRSSDTSITPTATNQTIFRSSGGYWLYSDSTASTGVTLGPGGGSWTSVSDRNRKENFFDVDGEDVLRRLRAVPVTTWNYKSQDASVRHMGPMAQDFYAAFGLDQTDKGITTVDMDGVLLAGVKALDGRTTEHDARITALENELKAKDAMIQSLLERLEALEKQKEQRDQ